MALKAMRIPITLDTERLNDPIPKEFHQGATDKILVITVTRDGRELLVEADFKITSRVVFPKFGGNIYTYEVPSNLISIVDGKIEVGLDENMVNVVGESKLIIDISAGLQAFTYHTTYFVNKTYGRDSTDPIGNLPTVKTLETQVNKNTLDLAGKLSKGSYTGTAEDLKNALDTQKATHTTDMQGVNSSITSNGQVLIDHAAKITTAEKKIETNTVGITTVSATAAENHKDIVLNQKAIADNKAKVDQHVIDIPGKIDSGTYKGTAEDLDNDIKSNVQKIATTDIKVAALDTSKASKDMSDVPSFTGIPDGAVLYKDAGVFKDSGMKMVNGILTTPKQIVAASLQVDSDTVYIGDIIALHENGALLEMAAATTKKSFTFLDYENDPIKGTTLPTYYKKGVKNFRPSSSDRGPIVIVPGDSIVMSNVVKIPYGAPTIHSQVQAMYFNFASDVKNLRMSVEVGGTPVAHYPSKRAWEGKEPGLNLSAGLRPIPLDPFFSFFTFYDLTFKFKADDPINLRGNGTKPYLAVDRNIIEILYMAVAESGKGLSTNDLTDALVTKINGSAHAFSYTTSNGLFTVLDNEGNQLAQFTIQGGSSHGASPEEIARSLEGLSEVQKLDYVTGLKNTPIIPTVPTETTYLRDMPKNLAGQAGKILQVNADEDSYELIKLPISERGKLGMQGNQAIPVDSVWVLTSFKVNEEILIPAQNRGDQYMVFTLPAQTAAVVGKVLINQTALKFSEHDFVDNGYNYKLFIATTTINSSQPVRFKIEFAVKSSSEGITIDDGSHKVSKIKTINIKGMEVTKQDIPGEIDLTSSAGRVVLEDVNKTKFEASNIKSILRDIEIHQISNPDGTLSANLNINPALLGKYHQEGIMEVLGNDELINSEYSKSRLYFGDSRVKGGSYVYKDLKTKSIILQDIDPDDDPNISGGTTFMCGVYFTPTIGQQDVVSQDGYIEIGIADLNNNYITDVNGDPMGVRVVYKAGDPIKRGLYLGECQIKGQTKVHAVVKPVFPTEEIIGVGANSAIVFQSISKEESSGIALLAFMSFTGYVVDYYTKYYGTNTLNISPFLSFPEPEEEFSGRVLYMGDNTMLSVKTKAKIEITGNQLHIKDNGADVPVWSVSKFYDALDTKFIRGKKYDVKITLKSSSSAFVVALVKYTGDGNASVPVVESFNNNTPLLTEDWAIVDTLLIPENVAAGGKSQSKEFTIPGDAKNVAIMLYQKQSGRPLEVALQEFVGNITPWVNKLVITDSSHIVERNLLSRREFYKSVVNTPKGASSYRYTSGASDTKVPIGVFSGGDGLIINDNSWADPTAVDPNNTQGDFQFKAAGVVSIQYSARCYNEASTDNEIHFRVAKNNGDGTFTDVPDSEITSTIKAHTNIPQLEISGSFSITVKELDSYRVFMRSNISDGFFIESKTSGDAMFEIQYIFDEITLEDKLVLDTIDELKVAVQRIDSEFRVTPTAHDNGVYAELDYDVDSGKPEINAKKI